MFFGVMPLKSFVAEASGMYSVTYYCDGLKIDTRLFNVGEKITFPSASPKVGCRFSGWMLQDDDYNIYEETTMPAYNLECNATYDLLAYAITFNANGGYFESTSECEEILIAEYAAYLMQPEEIPVRPGYIFNGWTLSGSEKLETFPILIPAKNLYYEANWAQDLSFCTVKEVRKEPFIQDKQLGFYSVTVYHEPNKVQILSNSSNFELDLVYDRNDELVSENLVQPGLVSIKAFDYHHNEVELGSDDVIYEVWTVAAELKEGEYLVRCQRESGDWEFLEYSYQYIMVYDEITDGTFCGKLESSGITVVIDGNESWISPIVVDGITYKVKKNLIPDTIDEYIGQDVVFTVENGEIVWFSTVWDLVQKINCNLVVTDEITYSGKKYSTDEIEARIDIKYSYKSKNIAELKAISELGVAVSGVKLKSSKPDLLNFDGKAEKMVLFNDIVPIGGSASKTVTINVDSSYKISDLIENEVVSITCDMSAAGDAKLIEKTPCNKNITVINKNYEKPIIVEEPDKPEENDASAAKAATELDKITSSVTIAPSTELKNIFTDEQINAIGDLILCEAVMASAPADTFERVLSKDVISKVYGYSNGFFTLTNGSLTFTVSHQNKDGKKVTAEFKCDYNSYLVGQVQGTIYYRIIKPASMAQESYRTIGHISQVNISAFSKAAYALAESEIKNAVKPWGDKVDWATDLIFGKTVNKILKQTKWGSASGLVWDIITAAAKSVKIECPVDVYVYNSNDELVAAVEDNEVILTNDKAQITVNGDTKYVTLFDESYYIVYEATADGTMCVTVNEHANSEDILRTVVIDEIPLESGAVFSQNIDGKILEESNYSITADDETVYTPDSDETTFHYHETDGEWFEGKAVDCTKDGWNYTRCNICGDWYKEIILCEGHKDKDANGYCDDCKTLIWQTITWIVDGEEITTICKEGSEITSPEAPTKTGYTFEGWTPKIPDAMPAENLTFTAIWSVNSYDAVFDANGGVWSDGAERKVETFDFDSEIVVLEVPSKPGYVFLGWALDNVNLGTDLGVMDDINGKEFKAVWVASTDTRYAVETYTMNIEGEYVKIVQNFTGETDSIARAEYTVKTGFTLNNEKSVLNGVIAEDNSLVLKVYIDRNVYTFTTVVDGVSNETKYFYESLIAEPANPNKIGYTFVEWDAVIPATMPANNITVTAKFELSFKMSIRNPSTTTISYGDSIILHADMNETLPSGWTIKWTADNGNFSYSASADGKNCTISPNKSGDTTFTASVYDENGNEICKDTQTMKSKAGFFDKFIAFFKKLFGATKVIPQAFKVVF